MLYQTPYLTVELIASRDGPCSWGILEKASDEEIRVLFDPSRSSLRLVADAIWPLCCLQVSKCTASKGSEFAPNESHDNADMQSIMTPKFAAPAAMRHVQPVTKNWPILIVDTSLVLKPIGVIPPDVNASVDDIKAPLTVQDPPAFVMIAHNSNPASSGEEKFGVTLELSISARVSMTSERTPDLHCINDTILANKAARHMETS